jgi:catechol 2,3-dioxygenase-like lactoylglutathione lyase family enzyme
MVTRIGHVCYRTTDIEARVSFAQRTLGLFEVERRDGVSYLTCNSRHHEMLLVESDEDTCDHVAFEVADASGLAAAAQVLANGGYERIEPTFEEFGIDDSIWATGPGGLPVKFFYGMDHSQPSGYDTPGVRPVKFEHVTVKSSVQSELETFLMDLGMQLSDRTTTPGGAMSWFRPGVDHHGVSIVEAPQDLLHHVGWATNGWDDLRRVGERLKETGGSFLFGPGHHGIGDNYFCYFFDPAGVIVEYDCSMLQIERDSAYQPRDWPDAPTTVNQWGAPLPPLEFLMGGTPWASSRQPAAEFARSDR